jgi:peptide/nickel transport system substrate-binding protein
MAAKDKAILLFTLAPLLIYTGCWNGTKEQHKIFRYNESKGIATLDPAFARSQPAIWPVIQLYNGLLQLDDSLNIIPCIAKSYKVSGNGKVYTFFLRNDVYFHNHQLFKDGKGREVVAADFEFSFNRIIDSKTASPGAWVFNNIDRTIACNGFEAVNDTTFKIYLSNPFSAFLGILTTPYCFVVPKEVVTYYGKDFRNHPIGTGPFQFKIWEEGEKLVLVKNQNYFEKDANGSALPRIDGVAITFIADKQAEFLEFLKGRIDFISGINAMFKDELITYDGELNQNYKEKIKLLKCPYLNVEYLGILADTTSDIIKGHPLTNKLVRQAINLAIDRKKMMLYLRNNIGYPATAGFIPKGTPSFNERVVKGFNYNPDSASKLLAKAGFSNGKGLIPFKIITSSDYLDICEFVQKELEKVNIPCEIEVANGLAFREMLANAKMQVFRASWIADYPDAENFLSLFYSKNFCPKGPNYTRYSNKMYDELFAQSQKETEKLKRFALYNKMDNMIVNEAVIVPLYYDVAVRLVQGKIDSLGVNPLNILNLKCVKIK